MGISGDCLGVLAFEEIQLNTETYMAQLQIACVVLVRP